MYQKLKMNKSTIPKDIEVLLGKLICNATKNYFKNEENCRAFEKWYLEKYKKKYEWKGA